MVAIKAADVDRFVAQPRLPVILVYGPDAGLVAERTAALLRSAVADPGDPFSLALIGADALAESPHRLVEEAHTVPLFGGRRAIHVKAAGRGADGAVAALIKAPPGADCRVVIEAGDLRRAAPLRTLCERAKVAAALPCYPDSPRSLARLIDDETARNGVAITPAASRLLATLLGGDRRASRSEIDKLILYRLSERRIDVADVMAVVSDAASPAIDGLLDAAFAGSPGEVAGHFRALCEGGTNPGTIAAALVRHTAALHVWRLAVDAGTPVDEVVGNPASGIHFSRAGAVRAALATFTTARLERLLGRLGALSLDVRRNGALAGPLIERALLLLARDAKGRAARSGRWAPPG